MFALSLYLLAHSPYVFTKSFFHSLDHTCALRPTTTSHASLTRNFAAVRRPRNVTIFISVPRLEKLETFGVRHLRRIYERSLVQPLGFLNFSFIMMFVLSLVSLSFHSIRFHNVSSASGACPVHGWRLGRGGDTQAWVSENRDRTRCEYIRLKNTPRKY